MINIDFLTNTLLESEGPLPPVFEGLVPSVWVAVGAIITLGILLFVITKFAYFPTKKYLDERKKHIETNIDSAVEANTKAHQLLSKADTKFHNAEKEIQVYLEEQRKQANLEKENIILQAKEQSNQMLLENKKRIELEKQQAMNEIKNEISEMSVLIASKLIQENLTDKKNQELIDSFIKDLEV